MSNTVSHVHFVVLLTRRTEFHFAVLAADDFVFVLTDIAFPGLDADFFKLRWINGVVHRSVRRTTGKRGGAVHFCRQDMLAERISQVVFKRPWLMSLLLRGQSMAMEDFEKLTRLCLHVVLMSELLTGKVL